MGILAVGSVALDSIETPFGRQKDILGGSATFFSMSASFFDRVDIVAAIGGDFPGKYISILKNRGIGLGGLEIKKNGKTFRWSGRYGLDLNTAQTISTHLNVFKDFEANVPRELISPKVLFLANIDPDLQIKVLRQVKRPGIVACDSMNYWIDNKRASLEKLIGKIDILLLNESETRQLSEETNLIKAAKRIMSLGPKVVVIKKGEHGSLYVSKSRVFIAPAYPVENVYDPTGAGDTFAGGMMGYLSKTNGLRWGDMKKAVIYGSVMASFAVEGPGISRLLSISLKDVNKRYEKIKEMTRF